MPNTFGQVVNDFLEVNFPKRCFASNQDYPVEKVFQKVQTRHEIIFGSLCNYVQYFAEIGGFDAIANLFKVEEESKEGAATAKVPFKTITYLIQAFSRIESVLKPEVSKRLTTMVKEHIVARINTITEKDLRDMDKDEIGDMLKRMTDFLLISDNKAEASEFLERFNL